MADKDKAHNILKALVAAYPDARCELDFSSDFELLVAVILSAQCTDKRVNLVTKELFKIANTPKGMLELGQEELEKIIYPCGFFRQKSKSILESAEELLKKHNGAVPNDFEALVALKGVGRKTANVVLGELFNTGGVAVDTHVFRVSRRLGLSNGKDPKRVEEELTTLLKGLDRQVHQVHHALIFHGRYCCKSRSPNCEKCRVKEYCTM